MATYPFLGKQERIIDPDIKNTLTSHNQGKTFNNMLIMGHDIRRRPDGVFTIVSRNTIFNRDSIFLIHDTFLDNKL